MPAALAGVGVDTQTLVEHGRTLRSKLVCTFGSTPAAGFASAVLVVFPSVEFDGLLLAALGATPFAVRIYLQLLLFELRLGQLHRGALHRMTAFLADHRLQFGPFWEELIEQPEEQHRDREDPAQTAHTHLGMLCLHEHVLLQLTGLAVQAVVTQPGHQYHDDETDDDPP